MSDAQVFWLLIYLPGLGLSAIITSGWCAYMLETDETVTLGEVVVPAVLITFLWLLGLPIFAGLCIGARRGKRAKLKADADARMRAEFDRIAVAEGWKQ